MANSAPDSHAAYRRRTVEVETVYPTDLLLRWLTAKIPGWRVRLAKFVLPRGHGVVREVGYEDIRV